MKAIGDVDCEDRSVVVQPARSTSRSRAAPLPQASSTPPIHRARSPARSRERRRNSGGPHCLKYGTTVNHVLELEAVLTGGAVVRFGSAVADRRVTIFAASSSERRDVRDRHRDPPSPHARKPRRPHAPGRLSRDRSRNRGGFGHRRRRHLPVALEMMDHSIIQAIGKLELPRRLPPRGRRRAAGRDRGDRGRPGRARGRDPQHLLREGEHEIRVARDAGERAALWPGARRLRRRWPPEPEHVSVRPVVPRNRLPEVWPGREISREIRHPGGQRLHAGDGNLHPILLYDEKDPEQTSRNARRLPRDRRVSLEAGGSLSGEHGIGLDKRDYMDASFRSPTGGDAAGQAGLRPGASAIREGDTQRSGARGTALGSQAPPRGSLGLAARGESTNGRAHGY